MRTGISLLVLGVAACNAPAQRPEPDDPVAVGTIEAARSFLGTRGDLVWSSSHRSLVGDHVRFQRVASDGTPIVDSQVSVHLTGTGPRYASASIRDDHPEAIRLVGARVISDDDAVAAARAVAPRAATIERTTVEHVALPSEVDASVVRAGFRAVVVTSEPAHAWEVWIDGVGIASLRRDLYQFQTEVSPSPHRGLPSASRLAVAGALGLDFASTGTAYVYDPNPIAQTGNLALADGNGATTSALDAARISVALANLDGSGVLRGTWVDAHTKSTGARATSASNAFLYDRSSLHFDEAMVYYHLDRIQTYLQSLGFTDANARQVSATVDAQTADNSFYDPSGKTLNYGTGGVDDAQDADVIAHEYGHSIQDNIVPGFGGGDEGAMGEGFGDLLAASVEPRDAVAHPMMVDRACIATWDATSYDTRNPPCLRRIDGPKHYPESTDGEVHDDGEIWSAGNWDLYAALGDPKLGLSLVLESFYSLNSSATFQQWADAMVAADVAMHAGAHVSTIRKALWKRGLDRTPLPPGTLGTIASVNVSLGATTIGNNVDTSVTIHQAGTSAIRLHYSAFNLESKNQCFQKKCDNVYLFDGQGQLFQIEGGNVGAHDSVVIPGDTVVVRWVTNGSGTSAGFHIDRYDYDNNGVVVVDAPVDAAVVTVDAPSVTPIDAADPTQPDGPVNGETPDAGTNGKTGQAAGGCCDAGRGPDASYVIFGLLMIGHGVGRRRRKSVMSWIRSRW